MTLVVLLLSGAGLAAAVGWFAPEIRDAWYFAPARARAESALDNIAVAERSFHNRTKQFDTFSTAEAPRHLQALGVSEVPGDYMFDATATRDNGLRLRALPRSEQVLALKIGAQIYVDQLTTAGGVVQRGWVP